MVGPPHQEGQLEVTLSALVLVLDSMTLKVLPHPDDLKGPSPISTSKVLPHPDDLVNIN